MPWAIFIDDPLFGKAGIQRIEDLSKRRDKHFDLSPEESFELQSIQSTERKKQWQAPSLMHPRGVLKRYAKQAVSAIKGAYLE